MAEPYSILRFVPKALQPRPSNPKHFKEPPYYPAHWTEAQIATAKRAFQYLQNFGDSYMSGEPLVSPQEPRKFTPLRRA